MNGTTSSFGEQARISGARRNITYLLLFAIVMFFVALSSAYVVSRSSALYWVTFRIPRPFLISTAIIVVSSVAAQLGLVAVRRGQARAATGWILVTLLLGCGFTWFQRAGWLELIGSGNYMADKILRNTGAYGVDYTVARKGITLLQEGGSFFLPDDLQQAKPLNAEMEDYRNTSASYFYVLTVGHWLHLAGGLWVYIILALRSLMGRYSAEEHTGIWQGTMYWHFLGALWVYLLLFLTVVH